MCNAREGRELFSEIRVEINISKTTTCPNPSRRYFNRIPYSREVAVTPKNIVFDEQF